MDYRKKLIVEPGSQVRLKDVDPGFHGKHESEAEAAADLAKNVARLTKLQELLYAERKHALLIVLQGIDAAGKDGTCWHVMTAMNPQGTTVTGFKQPTPEELGARLPLAGASARAGPRAGGGLQPLALRGRAGGARAQAGAEAVWSKRYDLINDFEELLAANGTTILKFFLYISPEEQLERFKAAARRSGAAVEDQRQRLHRARALGRLCQGLRGHAGEVLDPARALVSSSRRTTSGSATSRCRRSSPTRSRTCA